MPWDLLSPVIWALQMLVDVLVMCTDTQLVAFGYIGDTAVENTKSIASRCGERTTKEGMRSDSRALMVTEPNSRSLLMLMHVFFDSAFKQKQSLPGSFCTLICLKYALALTMNAGHVSFHREARVNKPKEATTYLKEIVEYTFAHHASYDIFTKHQYVSSSCQVHRKS